MDKLNLAPSFPHVNQSDSGKLTILNTSDNLRALLAHIGYEARLNQMNLETDIFSKTKCIGSPEVIRSQLISYASIHGLPKSTIDDHFSAVASEQKYHPVREWLEGDWDGVFRVDTVLSCIKAKDMTLANIVLKRWLIGCVASLYVPNFKSKLVPVLQGEQSYKKTAFVERIASVFDGAFLEGAELNPDNKDSVLSVIRSWIVELGELERSTKNSQGALKAFITKACDTVRPPYARTDIKKSRQTNLIATVNGTNFLRDETGNSRYAVIELIGATDMELLNDVLGWQYRSSGEVMLLKPDNLRQFWLELKYIFLVQNTSWMLSDDEQARVSLASNLFVDKGVWYNTILEYLSSDRYKDQKWMTTSEICLHLGISRSKSNQVGKALTLLSKEDRLSKKSLNGLNYYLFSYQGIGR
ncbi:VapE domain-containing protein [Vibrio astriarenae]